MWCEKVQMRTASMQDSMAYDHDETEEKQASRERFGREISIHNLGHCKVSTCGSAMRLRLVSFVSVSAKWAKTHKASLACRQMR